jgi:hypothetical protein
MNENEKKKLLIPAKCAAVKKCGRLAGRKKKPNCIAAIGFSTRTF